MKNKLFNKGFIILATLLNLFCSNAKSQDTLTGALVEQKSLQLYQDKNWKELIKFGNSALKQNIDYFYLQMRVGIAYFEQKNYCLAEVHFRKALDYNSTDELALEYLYYCYVYTGRTDDARLWSKKFSKELAAKTGTDKKSFIDFITLEGGTKITDSAYYHHTITLPNKTTYKDTSYFKPAIYFQVGLNHTIKNRVSFFHAFTYFNQKNFVGTLTQIQYYLKAAVPIKNGWLISPSFHYVNINFTSQFTTTTTDTLWPPGVPHLPPPPGFPPLRTSATSSVTTVTSNSSYYVGSLAIQKIIKRFTLSVGTTLSNINGQTEYIHSGALYYSPLGNSKIVLGCTGYLHTLDYYKTSYLSALPFVYVQPLKRFSLKASYLYNKGNNIIEDNGYFINNSPDLTKSRWALLANFYISKKVTLYATYQLENKLENLQQFNYRYNIIVAGIKITP